jgi:NAD(P)-dependent dehydrogenase (short-subunit alcohol dehydrogenase family)
MNKNPYNDGKMVTFLPPTERSEQRMKIEIASGRKALVAGGASGLGLDIGRALASNGARVALLDKDQQRAEAAAAEIEGAVATAADVRSAEEVRAGIAAVIEEFGGLDTLVIAAGVVTVNRLAAVSEEEWDRQVNVNLKGAFLACQAAGPSLTESGRGRIVMISSDAGRRGEPMLAAYSASKFGMIGMGQSLASELAPRVTVNCICPVGVPTTGMGQQMLSWKVGHTGKEAEEVMSSTAKKIPLGRNASERDITGAALFLISEAGAFITGIALDVDGGASLDALPGAD